MLNLELVTYCNVLIGVGVAIIVIFIQFARVQYGDEESRNVLSNF